MTNVTDLPKTKAQEAIATAEEELAEEILEKGVRALKAKLRERAGAETILANIEREIIDLKEQIEQGNL